MCREGVWVRVCDGRVRCVRRVRGVRVRVKAEGL